MSIVTFLVFGPSEDVSAYKKEQLSLEANLVEPNLQSSLEEALAEVAPRPAPAFLTQFDEQVRSGDSLSKIFQRLSLGSGEVFALANASSYAKELKRIKPGEMMSVVLYPSGDIKEVVYQRSLMESFRYTPSENGYQGEKLTREPESVVGFKHVNINHSLFLDGDKAGLSHGHIMQIAGIFGWDIDFALDIRSGDTFSVLFEDKYIDGQKVSGGEILGAEFTNQGETFKAVRYTDSEGNISYYTPDGKPMRKAFLRAPVDFTRVSSNFNPNRLHPIHKTKRPHRGVDYAAPRGTPVYSAGDGRVVRSGYTKANGNYVVIQHGDTYTTKYLHLHKRSVKTGQHVQQRQVIGSVGSTGYSTGPHLHYEFLVHGVHRNPRTVKLPQAEPIKASEMADFKQQTAPLLAELSSQRSTLLASLSTTPLPQ